MNFTKRRWRNITITMATAITLAVLHQAVETSLYQATFLSGWLLFIYAFDTNFPAGPFEAMMNGLL